MVSPLHMTSKHFGLAWDSNPRTPAPQARHQAKKPHGDSVGQVKSIFQLSISVFSGCWQKVGIFIPVLNFRFSQFEVHPLKAHPWHTLTKHLLGTA